MKKSSVSIRKRALSVLLTLCMLFTSVGGYAADWFAAYAEEAVGDDGGNYESPDSGSHESSSSESHESSDSGSHESSDSGSHDSSESESHKGEESVSHESSVSESFESKDSDSGTEHQESSGESDNTTTEQTVLWGGITSEMPAETADETLASHEEAPAESGSDDVVENTVVWGKASTETPADDTSASREEALAESGSDDVEENAVVWGEVSTETPADDTSASREEAPAESGSEEGTENAIVWDEAVPETSTEAVDEIPAADEEAPVDETTEDTVVLDEAAPETPVETGEETDNNAPSEEAPEASETEDADTTETEQTAGEEASEAEAVAEEIVVVEEPTEVVSETIEATGVGKDDALEPLMAQESTKAAEVSDLQKKVNEKLGSLSTLNERITIILNKGTTYKGDLKLEKDSSKTYGESFGVDLVAEDSGDDNLQADGTSVIAGNITIKGINLAIRGANLKGAVSVEDAKLDYSGTKGTDKLDVTVGEGATATIDTGLGNDTVTASVTGGGAADIRTGEGDDTVNLIDESLGKVSVDTGAGDDTVSVDARYGSGEITVSTGADDDSVSVSNGGDRSTKNPTGTVDVDLGEGMNDAEVDLGVSDTVKRVKVKGGSGSDHLNITGTLNKDVKEEERATGTEAEMKLSGANNTLTVQTEGIENLTDALENKRTVKLNPTDTGVIDRYVAEHPFTNYIYNGPTSKLKKLVVTTKDGQKLALSGILLDAAYTHDDGNKIVINEGATVDAKGMKLILKGNDVEINGTLMAELINIEAADGTAYTPSISERFNNFKENTSEWLSWDTVENAGSELLQAGLDMINVSDEATITIGEKAIVYASGDVIALAHVEQSGGMITLLSNMNVVNVKVGKASVNVAGKVYAGYDFSKEKVDSDRGSISMDARVSATTGYSSDGKAIGSFPLGVTVIDADTKVEVQKGAVIEAARDVSIRSEGKIKVSNKAVSGYSNTPAAVAVSVLINDVRTTVNGTVHAYKGDAVIRAKGDIDADTSAGRGSSGDSISGGYVGVTVALQDVKAEVGQTGQVTADKGSVKVDSVANENVNTTATAANCDKEDDNAEDTTASVLKTLLKAWNWIKGKIKSETAQQKIDAAIKKIAIGEKAVRLDDNASKKGEVKLDTDIKDGKAVVKVSVTPWPGYRVKTISARGINPGEDRYAIGSTDKFSEKDGVYSTSFTMSAQNVTVFVEYEEIESYTQTAADLFEEKKANDDVNVEQVVNDAVGGTKDEPNDGKDEEKSGEKSKEEKTAELKLSGTNGAVLTYDTDAKEPDESLKNVAPGTELRLVPNPNSKYKLADGGLKATWSVKDGEKTVKKTVVVNADAHGRYIVKIPDNIVVDEGVSVAGNFVPGEDNSADTTQTQLTGSVAVTVATNDNKAYIDPAATIKAGGKVSVNADAVTYITTAADGTAVDKQTAGGKKKEEETSYAISRPKQGTYTGYDVALREAALILDPTENGKVTWKAGDRNKYTFTATPEAGYSVSQAVITYLEGGKRKTVDLKKDKDGNYTLDFGNMDKVDKGSMAQVSFIFAKEGEYGKTVSTQAAQAIIPNAFNISYNGTADKDGKTKTDMGTVAFREAKTDKDGNITSYVFAAEAKTDKGYVLDVDLKATWTDAKGKKQEAALTKKDGLWVLENKDLPEGALITINGKFKDDLHDFTVDKDKTKDGSVKLYDKNVKRTDAPKFSVTPDAGYAVKEIVVELNNGTTYKLSDEDTKIKPAKDEKGKEIEGVYTFDVPELKDGSAVSVYATFQRKTIGLYTGEGKDSKDYTLSEYTVATGDKVKLSLSKKKIEEGYKISGVKVTDASGKVVAEGKGASFSVPKDTKDDAKLTVTATLSLKDVTLEAAKLENGTVEPSLPRADRGDMVTVTVKPEDNFMVKAGTLKAVIKAKDGSYTEEVYMGRTNDTTYNFTVPENISDPSQVTITFTGEFEPGQSDSSAVDTSLGAGIAVSVVNSESKTELKGKVEAGNLAVGASQKGGTSTTSKAGYSKGNIGAGGAVSVQVASQDAKALIYKDANLTVKGKVSVDSKADVKFKVSGDANSKKESRDAGVGAGIAVAVNGTDSAAAIQDGAKLTTSLKNLSVTANQKVKDDVTAIAGAKGGTSVVPVAAVDVIGATANASIGRVFDGKLKVKDTANVSASTDVIHTVTANASATGKGTGVGIAAGVSVVKDVAQAVLNQSVEAATVTVASKTISSMTETVTASAAGGKKDKKSADKQADSLLGGAAKLANKNKSGSVTAEGIDAAAKKRQKAETSEGTVGVAGAVAVNIQTSENKSEVKNGVDIKAGKVLAVTGLNGTTSKVKANASTTNSDVGVGVGVAVNIVNLNNLAHIGDGEIEAAMLKLTATTQINKPKEKKKEEKKKTDTPDEMAAWLGDTVKSYINDLVKEMGLDQYISDTVVGEIVGKVVTNVSDELLKTTGISQALAKNSLSSRYDAAKKLLADTKDGVVALVSQLQEPMMKALGEVMDLEDLSEADLEGVQKALMNQVENRLAYHLQTAGGEVLEGTRDGLMKYLKDHVSELLGGVFSDGLSATFNKVLEEAGKEISKSADTALENFITYSLRDALGELTKSVPALKQANIDRVVNAFNDLKDAYSKESLQSTIRGMSDNVTRTFKEKVFDYEDMMKKLKGKDFKKLIAEGFRNAAKTALVTLTNESLGKLSDNYDLRLEAEQAKATGHVIDTQAISGAGTRDVGVAGSVAVTVVNAATTAELEGSSKTVHVYGEAIVNADELRTVNNVASAATDAKGNASANKSAVTDAKKDVGGGNDGKSVASNDHVKMTVGVGGTATIRQGDMADVRPKIYISFKDGYDMPADKKVNYSFSDKSGFEVSGTVEAKKDDNGWYVETDKGELEKADKSVNIELELNPVTIDYAIPGVDVLTAQNVEAGAVTITAKDGTVKDDKLYTHVGDKVEVKVKNVKGRTISGIGYEYTDSKGKKQEVMLAKGSVSGDETVFTFDMPAANLNSFVVQFDKEDPEKASKTSAKDGTGKGVGVGAAFSMVYGETQTKAEIGMSRDVQAGTLTVTANSDHTEDIASVAGSDPMAGTSDEAAGKKYGVDASVALNILDNNVLAYLRASKVNVETHSWEAPVTDKSSKLTLTAKENSITNTTSSAFAVGGATAVGASVAVNLANTAAKVEQSGEVEAYKGAVIGAESHSEDNTNALATAMGADIARALNKLNQGAEDIANKANKLLDGSAVDDWMKTDDAKKSKNETAKNISDRMNLKKQEDGDEANENLSVSTNVLRSQGVKVEGEEKGNDAAKEGESFIKSETGKDVKLQRDGKSSKWQVAAAVGVTVANHAAETLINGNITASEKIDITSKNTANFATMGTGAAMSLAEKSNAIAAGVAVSVSDNTSKVEVGGNLTALYQYDLNVASTLTQNVDGDFAGKLAAQALSGSVAGKDASTAIAGAVSVLVSHAKSTIDIARGDERNKRQLRGNHVTVDATDKSRLTARSGGLSLSNGASMGMGVASTTIVSGNTVTADVGEYTAINAIRAFKLNAEKIEIKQSDYKNLLSMRSLVSDSSKLDDKQRESANTGFIDMHKDGDKSYKVDVNLSSDKLLNAVNGLNYLSAQNTYAEAIAGSLGFGAGKASIAGSFAVAVTNNTVRAALGDHNEVNISSSDEYEDLQINAADGNSARIIAGSLSAAPAKASVGATVAVLVNSDDVSAKTGQDSKLTSKGHLSLNSEVKGDIQLFTGAMSVAVGSLKNSSANAAGGAVNVIVNNAKAETNVGDRTQLRASSTTLSSNVELDLMAISGSANVAAGVSGMAAGGTVNVIVDNASAFTTVGKDVRSGSSMQLLVKSDVSDQLISGTASLSAALTGSGVSGAGVANVIVSRSKAHTTLGDNFNGDFARGIITSNNDAWMLNASAALAGGGSTALGGAFNVNVFDRESIVTVKSGELKARGYYLKLQSSGKDTSILAGLSAAGGLSGAALSGNAVVLVEKNKIHTDVGENAKLSATENILLESNYSDFTVAAAGNIAASGTSAAVGATAVFVKKDNDVGTIVSSKDVSTTSYGYIQPLTTKKSVRGIYVAANASETQFIGAAGIAAGTGVGVTGVATILLNNNKVIADASKASLKNASTDITVTANDDTRQMLLAGGISLGGSAGVGASAVTLISGKTVKALAKDLEGAEVITVNASNKDNIQQLAISAGGAGGGAVEIGAAVQVLKSEVLADIEGTVSNSHADDKHINLTAHNDAEIINAAAAIAGAGGVAVTPVGTVTYFTGSSEAIVGSNAVIKAADTNKINIEATSKRDVNLYAVGASVSGGAGISGTANVLVSKDRVRALAKEGSSLTAGTGAINVTADGDYKLRSLSASIAGSGAAAIAVNGVVSVLKSNVTAAVDGKSNSNGALNIKANGKRDVINAGATLSGAGAVGVGVTVAVLVAGEKMSQDAADMLAYGNSEDKDHGKTTFDTEKFLNVAKASGVKTDDIQDLDQQVSGNGHYESQATVGNKTGSKDDKRVTFDGSTGYRSEDFNEDKYKNDGKDRGEKLNPEDTDDIKSAKTLNTYNYTDESQDAVIARIGVNANVTSGGDISVIAEQPTSADLFGGTAAVGGIVGVGVSAAVAVMRSNVLASAMGTIHTEDSASLTVQATSKAGDSANDDDAKTRDSALKETLKGKLEDVSNRGIRAVGLTASAGLVNVGVAASVVLTDNLTQALVGGNVTRIKNVNVEAKHEYKNVLAATAALGAGLVSANVSVAVAQANGTVTAAIGENATVNATGDVNVKTDSDVGVSALAATAGAGAAAINGGVGIAINRLKQNTAIRSGAKVVGKQNVNVEGKATTNTDSYLLGIAVGGVGAVLNAAVSNASVEMNTTVGETGKAKASVTAQSGKLNVKNDVTTNSTPKVLSVAGGGVAVGGNVLLAFNESTVHAKVENADVQVKDLNVNSGVGGTTVSELASAVAGIAAIGLSVNYADMRADNRAIVNTNNANVNVTGSMRVTTDDSKSTSALASTLSGSMGLITAGFNTAIARNNTRNFATLGGNGTLTVGDALTVHANGDATANAKLVGLNLSALDLPKVGGTTVVAFNDANTCTTVELPTLDVGKEVNFNATQKGKTDASIITGGGSLIGVKLSLAAAYGRANSLINVKVDKASDKTFDFNARNTGGNNVTTDISNNSFKLIGASAMAGVAYGQDTRDTKINLGSGTFNLHKLDVITDYTGNVTTNVTPSAGGVDTSLFDLAFNLADAKNVAMVSSTVELNKSTIKTDDMVSVVSEMGGAVNANVRPAELKIGGLSLGVSMANADQSGHLVSQMNLKSGKILGTTDGKQVAAKSGKLLVESHVKASDVNATVGTSGVKDRLGVTLFNTEINRAKAREAIDALAYINGNGKKLNRINVAQLDAGVKITPTDGGTGKTTATARTDGVKNFGLATLGNLDADAAVNDRFNTMLAGFDGVVGGPVNIINRTNGSAEAVGYAPGGLQAIDGGISNIKSGVGEKRTKQTSKIMVRDVSLESTRVMNIKAYNEGKAVSSMEQKTSYSLGSVKDSSQPTESWYDTGVLISDGSNLTSDESLYIHSYNHTISDSKMDASNIGIGLNLNKMIGENIVNADNLIQVGENVTLNSNRVLNVAAANSTEADAETNLSGGSIIDGQNAVAKNTITRSAEVDIFKGASLFGWGVNIGAYSGTSMTVLAPDRGIVSEKEGENDAIVTKSFVDTAGGFSFGEATSETTVTSNNIVNIGENVNIKAETRDITIEAIASSDKMDGGKYGIYTEAKVKAAGGGIVPKTNATNTLNFNNNININKNGKSRTNLTSVRGDIAVRVSNARMRVNTYAHSDGKGAGGKSSAHGTVVANLVNTLWLDNARLVASDKINLHPNNTERTENEGEAGIEVNTYAELYVVGGVVQPVSKITGYSANQIRTSNKRKVTFRANQGVKHIADRPGESIATRLWTRIGRLEIKTFLGNATLTKDESRTEWGWRDLYRCDFCGQGEITAVDNAPRSRREEMRSSVNKALAPVRTIQRQVERITKTLSPISDIHTVSSSEAGTTKARYGEKDSQAADKVYVLEIQNILTKDVRLDQDAVDDYQLWQNAVTLTNVHLLPNASWLVMSANYRLQYITDTMSGDVLNDGVNRNVDVITALTRNAWNRPIAPIGSVGALDFSDGTLNIPELGDVELRMYEISGSYVIDKFNEDFFRMMVINQQLVDSMASNGGMVPQEIDTYGITKTEAHDGYTLYWIGYTPETANHPDEELYYLIVNNTTDELAAYYTTQRAYNAGEPGIETSLLIYRDSASDRMEIEKYNLLFFTTEPGQPNIVKFITSSLDGRPLELPVNLRVRLRPFAIEGTTLSAYSVNDNLYVMVNGAEGTINLFEGFYTVTFDGDTFDSPFTRVEGIAEGDPEFIIKANQPIWPERTGDNTASDIGGGRYRLVDGEWVPQELPEGAEAA